jgi:hypothetical protein
MKSLSSNRDLYEYLLSFSSELKRQGLLALSETVAFASGQASSSSTEFLGESRIALRQVMSEEKGVLTSQERAELLDVLRQLDEALNGR